MASTFTVTTASDTNAPGSLRFAISQAGDGDQIIFDPSLKNQTISLTSTLNISHGVTIDGTGLNITVSGAGIPSLPTDMEGGSDFFVAGHDSSPITIKGLAINDGHGKGAKGAAGSSSSPDGGQGGDAAGGIFVQSGTLNLVEDTFNNNMATGGSGGFAYAGSSGNKGASGNAAGDVYVEPGATVHAMSLTASNDTAYPAIESTGGKTYTVSNDAEVQNATSPPCYCTGTLIRTPRGDTVVEDLAIGDVVVTSSGAERPIKWIGHNELDCRAHPRPADVMPVRIIAGALGPNRPERDLWVSPGHALCLDMLGEVLLTAGSLVNGSTIVQVDVERVTYWHVELDSHDLLIANGIPAESYLDMGNRAFFATGEGPIDAERKPGVVDDSCRPIFYGGPMVDAARIMLRVRAESLGWRIAERAAWEGVHLEIDGEVVHPLTRGLRACFALPSTARDVVLVSPTSVPAHVKDSADRRALGLCLWTLALDDGSDAPRAIMLNDARLCDGFYEAETDHRWTMTRARLHMALWEGIEGPLKLLVTLGGPQEPYWVAPVGTELTDAPSVVEAPRGLRLVSAA